MKERYTFGWSYPPGAANDPMAPYNQIDPPCEVCGLDVHDCICPECPQCHEVGRMLCYRQHGMTETQQQIDNRVRREKECAEELAAESAYWDDERKRMNEEKETDL